MIFLFKKKAFTLVEIMIGILIVSIVIIGGFQAFSAVTIGKVRLIQQTDIQKESLYFTQRLFEMVKKGGLIDYEEYFNRMVVGNTTFTGGHFFKDTGYGNFGRGGNVGTTTYGNGIYLCRSQDSINKITGTGCVSSLNFPSFNYTGTPQRYGEYDYQFVDYNANFDSDVGDEDGDGNIVGDDDDEYVGSGPNLFTSGDDLIELYLISGDKKLRTLFRWDVKLDPDAPGTFTCSVDGSTNVLTGSGCLGTIKYLKLDGVDRGKNHNLSVPDSTTYDGIVDTWLVDSDFSGSNGIVAGTGSTDYRVSLFPDTINVSEFKVYAYPNKDIGLSWKSTDSSSNISPYVILKFKLMPSWKTRKKIQGGGKELDFSMTINLSDIYSK